MATRAIPQVFVGPTTSRSPILCPGSPVTRRAIAHPSATLYVSRHPTTGSCAPKYSTSCAGSLMLTSKSRSIRAARGAYRAACCARRDSACVAVASAWYPEASRHRLAASTRQSRAIASLSSSQTASFSPSHPLQTSVFRRILSPPSTRAAPPCLLLPPLPPAHPTPPTYPRHSVPAPIAPLAHSAPVPPACSTSRASLLSSSALASFVLRLPEAKLDALPQLIRDASPHHPEMLHALQ